MARIEEMNDANNKQMVKTWSRDVDDLPRDGRSHHRRPRRAQARARVRVRGDGRPQARRVRADAHLPRPRRHREDAMSRRPTRSRARTEVETEVVDETTPRGDRPGRAGGQEGRGDRRRGDATPRRRRGRRGARPPRRRRRGARPPRRRRRQEADGRVAEKPSPRPSAPARAPSARPPGRPRARQVRPHVRPQGAAGLRPHPRQVGRRGARHPRPHARARVAEDWSKLLESAVANAEHNHELLGDDLRICSVTADEGPTLKRFRPRAMGRATRIRKRTAT